MATNDLVTGGNLDDCFLIDNANSVVTLKLGNGLQKDASGNVFVQLATTIQNIIVGHASGHQRNTTTAIARNCTIVRNSVGVYTVTFGTAHPDGTNYEVLLGQDESGTLRDIPKTSVIEGSKTANGFQVQVTVDDNSTTADILEDDFWSFEVLKEVSVLTNVSVI